MRVPLEIRLAASCQVSILNFASPRLPDRADIPVIRPRFHTHFT
jgi:hypothetical protein